MQHNSYETVNLKKNIGIFFLILLSRNVYSQGIEQVEYFSHEIKYTDGQNSYYNEILENISKTGTNNKYVPSIYYSFKLKYKVVDAGIGLGRLVVEMADFAAGTNAIIKGVDIGKLVIPEHINCELFVLTRGSQIMLKKHLNIKNISASPYIIIDTVFKVKNSLAGLRVKTENYMYFLSENTYNEFITTFKAIDEYSKSAATILKYLKSLESIDLKKVDMVQVYDIRLDEIEQYYSKLEQLNIVDKLKLKLSDPENYIINIVKLKSQIEPFRQQINQMLKNLDDCYFSEALKLLSSGDTSNAIVYLNDAIKLNILNVKAHSELTMLELKKNEIDLSVKRLVAACKIATPYAEKANEINRILHVILCRIVEKGELQNLATDYNKAIAILSNGYELCENILFFKCDQALYKAMQTAKLGMYNSYLSVVQKSIDLKLWEMAETYILQAKKYQEENNKFITDNVKTDKLLSKIYSRFVKSAEKNYASQMYETAIEYYNKALALCQKHNAKCENSINDGIVKCEAGIYLQFVKSAKSAALDSLVNLAEDYIDRAKKYQKSHNSISSLKSADSLLGSLKGVFYYQYIESAKTHLNFNRVKDALLLLMKAKTIENTYIVSANPELPLLIKKCVKSFVLSQNEGIDFLVWANKLDSAQKIIDEMNYYCSYSGIAIDSSVNEFIKQKTEKIVIRYCFNIKTDYERSVRMAEENIIQHNFITANDYLKRAINVAILSKKCILDTLKIHNRQVDISPIAKYQALLNDSKSSLYLKNYKNANSLYFKAEELYYKYEICKWGLKHDSISTFITNQKNSVFVDSSIVQFISEKKYDYALELVYSAKLKGMKSNLLGKTEAELGCLLELFDYKQNAIVDNVFISNKYARYSKLNRFMFVYRMHHLRRKFIL